MKLTRRQLIAYAALAAVVVALGVRYVLPGSADSRAGGSSALVVEAPSLAPNSAPSAPARVLVHVCGAVRSPGVYELAEGARLGEALELAGGATAKADLAAVNLAARVADGQQVVVPERGDAGSAPGAGGTEAGGTAGGGTAASGGGSLVSLNSATMAELEGLPGVGPATAQKIIDYRTTQGGFKSIEELLNVSGIGEVKFAALKDSVTL
ncbi:MAG: helix-hairpin-helix domain-containing protein [Thermoleophilia bacterium]